MANVLFYTYRQISPTKGGTERITDSVASVLTKEFSFNCYSAYIVPSEKNEHNSSVFLDSICFDSVEKKDELKQFILRNNIDRLLVQGEFILFDLMYSVVKDLNITVFFAHHFQPGWDAKIIRICYAKNTSRCYGLRWLKGLITYPYRKFKLRKQVQEYYRNVYQKSDKVVLLSSNFISPFKKFASIEDSRKFVVIPNTLSFDYFFPKDELGKKKKIVLIVARFDDNQKRIKLALEIWNSLYKKGRTIDWSLKIVGFGDDDYLYEDYVKKHDLRNVFFEGKQDSLKYYKEASIFMMTSKSEGWGLTLTESQQCGVVPIAFDSYESVSDIITNGENGFIVENNNINKYAEKLELLMSDDRIRFSMAKKSIESSKRFLPRNVGLLWKSLFD